MVAGVMETVQTDVSDFYQARWLGEADEAPIFNPAAVAATRALGGLRRLWLNINATPQEYLAWEDVMDHWLLSRSQAYGQITSYNAAVARFDQTMTTWWKPVKYDMHQKGQSFTCSWEELKSLLRQRFVPADCMVEQPSQATTTIVPSADMKADVGKDVMKEVEPLNGLNMQLKRVHNETCMTADRGQRWNLFQAQ
jgi:hypothetical protein